MPKHRNSIIADPEILTIEVDAVEGSVSLSQSVSFGLIVTELVINALKHAYPVDQGGIIRVSYVTDGTVWTLEVKDDGVGMPLDDRPAAVAGLGTNIVEALARQLKANVSRKEANPGTRITIRHEDAGNPEVELMPKVAAL